MASKREKARMAAFLKRQCPALDKGMTNADEINGVENGLDEAFDNLRRAIEQGDVLAMQRNFREVIAWAQTGEDTLKGYRPSPERPSRKHSRDGQIR